MSSALSAYKDSMARLDEIAGDSALLATTGSPFSQAITMAGAIKDIRSSLTDEVMKEVIVPLMNTKLGFRTDKDPARPVWNKRAGRMEAPEPYPLSTVRECLIEATLRGLPPVGNCWNIISGQSYVTKEGFWFLIGKRVPGLTDFKIVVGVPKMIRPAGDQRNASDEEAKGSLVTCYATWKLNGKEDRCEREIPIRVNAMMGADAIMGKAERKILAASYAQITGTALGDADIGETDQEPQGEPRDVTPPAGAAPSGRAKPLQRKDAPAAVEVEAAGGDDVSTANPGAADSGEPAPAEKSNAQRRDEALEEIDRQLAESFDEPITRAKFETMLRKQNLLSATGTLMGKQLASLEALVPRVAEIVANAKGEGGEGA